MKKNTGIRLFRAVGMIDSIRTINIYARKQKKEKKREMVHLFSIEPKLFNNKMKSTNLIPHLGRRLKLK